MKTNEQTITPDDHGRVIPVVFGEPVRFINGLRFFCIYCGVFHDHEGGNGYRQAKCFVDDSPYLDTGYYVAMVEKAPVPKKVYKAKRVRGGGMISGFLYWEKRRT